MLVWDDPHIRAKNPLKDCAVVLLQLEKFVFVIVWSSCCVVSPAFVNVPGPRSTDRRQWCMCALWLWLWHRQLQTIAFGVINAHNARALFQREKDKLFERWCDHMSTCSRALMWFKHLNCLFVYSSRCFLFKDKAKQPNCVKRISLAEGRPAICANSFLRYPVRCCCCLRIEISASDSNSCIIQYCTLWCVSEFSI